MWSASLLFLTVWFLVEFSCSTSQLCRFQQFLLYLWSLKVFLGLLTRLCRFVTAASFFDFNCWLSGCQEPQEQICVLRGSSSHIFCFETEALTCLLFTFTISNQAADRLIFRICGMLYNACNLFLWIWHSLAELKDQRKSWVWSNKTCMQAVWGQGVDCVFEVANGSIFAYQLGINVCFSYLLW